MLATENTRQNKPPDRFSGFHQPAPWITQQRPWVQHQQWNQQQLSGQRRPWGQRQPWKQHEKQPQSRGACFACAKFGHWRRDCPDIKGSSSSQ